jgi:hypothetical protein
MEAGPNGVAMDPPRRTRDRLAAAFLLVVLAAGTLVLCIGIPVGCLWLAAKLTDSIGTHFLVALPLTLACIGVFAALLYRVDRLYMSVTGSYAAARGDEEEDEDEPRVPRGPLEPMIFFFFAENPPRQVI